MKRIKSHFLEFPMTKEEMDNWETSGSAVMGKSHLILNPEVKFRTGLLYNKKPLE